jgi:hypothetical protein
MKRKLRGRRPAFEDGTSDGSQRHFDLEQLGAKLAQAAPLHGADKALARGVERFDHRAPSPRFRDDAHDARPVAQQLTDWRAQGIPVNPRSFDFRIAIFIYIQPVAGAALNHGPRQPMLPGRTGPVQDAWTVDHPKASHLLADDLPSTVNRQCICDRRQACAVSRSGHP